MTPKSFITIILFSPYGEKEERAVDLMPAATFGEAIAAAVFRGTHEQDLALLRRRLVGLTSTTPIPQRDGGWENKSGRVETLGNVFQKGKQAYVCDLSGRAHGMNGTLFVHPG